MTSAAVSAWTTSIHELQLLANGGSLQVWAEGVHEEVPAGSAAGWSACQAIIQRVVLQPPLTRAVWKKLTQEVKVTRKLAALCVQAQQQHQHTAPQLLYTTHAVLNNWLLRSDDFLSASPQSAPSSTFRQHLQGSGLVQLLAATLTGAQQRLDAAAAAVARAAGATGATAAAECGAAVPSSSVSGGRVVAAGVVQRPSKALRTALEHADVTLRNYFAVCTMLSTADELSPEAALPAAPAALGLIASVYSAGSAFLQQQQQQQQGPAGAAAPGASPLNEFETFDAAHETLRILAMALSGNDDNANGAFLQAPGARELLLSPELPRWLAVSLVVTFLGLNTHADPSSHTSSSRSRDNNDSSNSTQQQPGSASGISLDRLTPLSRSLFGLLGVDIPTALLAARHISKATLDAFNTLEQGYKAVLDYQVQQTEGGKPVSGQLLLHLEVHLLLSLFVQQLAAGIPASHPAATAAWALAQMLQCSPLFKLRRVADLHRLPLAEPYTGPQLALQVWPSPLPPPKQQPQQLQLQQYVLAPSAALLAELLPLVTSWCLKRLQLLHSRRQAQQQPQETVSAGSGMQPPSAAAMASLVGGYAAAGSCACVLCGPSTAHATWAAMRAWLNQLFMLLESASVPSPGAAAGAAAEPVAASSSDTDTYSCVLHAQDAILPHAASIMRALEGVLREAAVQAAAAAPAAGADAGSQAARFLQRAAWASSILCHHGPQSEGGHKHSALVIAALAAGPGSQVQRQLFSLCASMVKVADWDALGEVVNFSGSDVDRQDKLRGVAAYAAAAVLAAATPNQQQCAGDDAAAAAAVTSMSGSAAAVQLLPCLVIMGRCCLLWAEDLQQGIPACMRQQQQPAAQDAKQNAKQQGAEQQQQEQNAPGWELEQYTLATAQQWLQSGDVAAQLAAAGYAPQPLLQQLQQVLGALEVLDTNARNGTPDEAAFHVAVQHLQAAAQALCLFAIPCACNNTRCLWLAGPSELGLVSGRSCLCAGCRVARFHDRACQRASWKQHKPVCAALAAAAAAAAAAAVPP